ncbi:PQQ-like beta-propeller repeat protein [Saccharomonospora piscinae]|uniref:PQQ-like beta-propeller repeat protein n=1 Tax=Saccharomonospora piscinae TaxID=687388 RepID=UPI001FC96753|nr:PQQ-like beta-propeller repeat protein [Saccharomonospora piscinae]
MAGGTMRHRGTGTLALLAAASVAAGVALTACDGGTGTAPERSLPTPVVDRTPRTATPPPADADPPGPDTSPARWTAPFDDVPRTGGQMFVGLVFPADDEADLSIVGVAGDGSTRWSVRTNPACVGYGTTRVGDQAAAVVLASDADSRAGRIATRTSAQAYDVRDGSRLWGPTRVPGPMLGPGLIFGDATPSVVGGEQSERVMLAAHSGTPVEPPAEGAAPVYEHHGTGLFGDGSTVTAVDTATGETLWDSGSVAAPQDWDGGPRRVELLDSGSASTGDVVALRWTHADGGERTSLHDLRHGRLIATLGEAPEARTTVDSSTGTVVVSGLDQYRTTRAFDLGSGEQLWREDGGVGSLEITLAHEGTGYGTRAGRSTAIDVRTGKVVADGDWEVPVAATAARLLTPLPPEPGDGPSDRTEGSGPGYVAHESR